MHTLLGGGGGGRKEKKKGERVQFNPESPSYIYIEELIFNFCLWPKKQFDHVTEHDYKNHLGN
jgi:hypothetical protein